MRKRKRNPLDRIHLTYAGYLTFRQLANFLQVTRTSLKNWSGWYRDHQEYTIDNFPKPFVYGRHFVFRIPEIEEYLGIEIGNAILLDPLMRVEQVARRLKRNKRVVWKWVKEGKLKSVRFGNRVTRFQQNEIERFKKENEEWLEKFNPSEEVILARRERELKEERRKEKMRMDLKGLSKDMRDRIKKFGKRVGRR
jgi:excisionase family DNA binding protein